MELPKWQPKATEEAKSDNDKKNDTSSPEGGCVTDGNHVYFYSGVEEDSVLTLVKSIREVAATEMYHSIRGGQVVRPIYIHINSYGGYLLDGLAAADAIKALPVKTISIVEGAAASAATLLSMACTERLITPRSFMLIHQLSGWSFGTYEQMKDDIAFSDMLMETLVTFYTEHTNQRKQAIRKMLKRDMWVSAQTALELGFVDAITQ